MATEPRKKDSATESPATISAPVPSHQEDTDAARWRERKDIYVPALCLVLTLIYHFLAFASDFKADFSNVTDVTLSHESDKYIKSFHTLVERVFDISFDCLLAAIAILAVSRMNRDQALIWGLVIGIAGAVCYGLKLYSGIFGSYAIWVETFGPMVVAVGTLAYLTKALPKQ